MPVDVPKAQANGTHEGRGSNAAPFVVGCDWTHWENAHLARSIGGPCAVHATGETPVVPVCRRLEGGYPSQVLARGA